MPDLSEKGLIVELKELAGLNSYEARAYMALLRLGEAKPLKIAEEASIPYQRIYDILKSLGSKGFILDRNGLYLPRRPQEVFKAISMRVLIEARKRAKKIEELGDILERYKAEETEEGLAVIRGLVNSITIAMSEVNTCNESPSFMTYKAAEKVLDFWEVFVRLIDILPAGSKIIMPVSVTVPEVIMEELNKRNIRLFKSPFSIMDFMVACDTTIIGLPSGKSDVVSVMVKNKTFATAIKERLNDIIKLATPL